MSDLRTIRAYAARRAALARVANAAADRGPRPRGKLTQREKLLERRNRRAFYWDYQHRLGIAEQVLACDLYG
jgi:hypothetical protein